MEVALDRLVAAMLAVTVFAFACGSTIENRVLVYGRPARWYCLFVLLGLSLVYAVTTWPRTRGRPLPGPFLVLAGGLVALALLSTSWSVDAWLTLRRAGSFVVLLAIASCLVAATRGRAAAVHRLLGGLLAGAVAVGIAGLVVLAVDYDAAVQPASTQYGARFQGFEQNPDTAALLFAVVTPIAAYLLLSAGTWLARTAAGASLLLFAGSLAASGARGPMIGALVGTLVVVLSVARSSRSRLVLGAATAAVFAACIGISRIPDAKPAPPASGGTPTIRRTLFTSSGRRAAWAGAIHQAEKRPVAGYGFGTEAAVFVDRYAGFDSDLVENSYIGAALQLGIAGLALLLAVAAAAFGSLMRLIPARRTLGVEAACAGAAVAGLVVGVTQSYLFSVGNLATATLWICLFLLAGVGAQEPVAASSERIASRETRGSHSG
jgi:O-antigen ligase